MKYQKKRLHDLLKASNQFLDDPDNEANWRAFYAAFEAAKALEEDSLSSAPLDIKPANGYGHGPSSNSANATASLRDTAFPRTVAAPARRRRTLWRAALLGVVLGGLVFWLFGKNSPSTNYGAVSSTLATETATPVEATVPAAVVSTATLRPTRLLPNPTVTRATSTPRATTTHVPTRSPTTRATSTPTATASYVPTRSPIPPTTGQPTAQLTPPLGQIAGELTSNEPFARHVFEAHSGETVTITLSSDDFDTYLVLQDSDGTPLASNDDCVQLQRSCIGPVELPHDGTYTIIVDSYDRRSTGRYVLNIEFIQLVTSTSTPDDYSQCQSDPPVVIITSDASSVNLRSGPSTNFELVGPAYKGECFEVIGRNSDSSWVKVRTPSLRTGWILVALTRFVGDLVSVPVAE
jgi:hypothetical protein